MTTAEQIMHTGVETIPGDAPLTVAARKMRDLGIGALPVCASDGFPIGMITDRDIIVKCIAEGGDPARTSAGTLAGGRLITVDGHTRITDVLAIMENHRIRRLPVIEGNRLVGIITEADLARGLPEQKIGEFVEAVCAP
ncbi:CBS domain-containing protein [Nocardia pseudobrasiliensis]|uniref:CBS domain protein n=1 Tax=Nocardia pseudobrasiliensis TaxID=45979 RepID=A0A370IC64_9NOCA|nr:CBS domain-containing protein [Nocardia pseudobrasiliensis]RDI68315.1 CBS domain protein [Nocardia pseudobrasiliensis]